MIIIIAGLPGSGKTYLAKRISQRTGATHISSDLVRRNLQMLGRYSAEDKLRVYREMVVRTREELMAGRPVVVDATFQLHLHRTMFMDLALEFKVAIKWILLVADEQTTRKRLSLKRPDSEADFQVYTKIRDQFEPLTLSHLTLTATDENIEEILAGALEYIRDT